VPHHMASVMDVKQISSGSTTVRRYPNYMAVVTSQTNTSYAVSHDGTGFISTSILSPGQGDGANQLYYAPTGKDAALWQVRQAWLGFDTSGLGSGTISSVTMRLYSLGTTDTDGGFTLECRCVDFGSALDTADWKYLGPTDTSWGTLGASLSSASLAGVGQRTLTTSGTNMATHINRSGNTRFLFNIDKDRTNSGTPSGTAGDKFNLINFEYSTALGRTELEVVMG
jgi:hypothetical protein